MTRKMIRRGLQGLRLQERPLAPAAILVQFRGRTMAKQRWLAVACWQLPFAMGMAMATTIGGQ